MAMAAQLLSQKQPGFNTGVSVSRHLRPLQCVSHVRTFSYASNQKCKLVYAVERATKRENYRRVAVTSLHGRGLRLQSQRRSLGMPGSLIPAAAAAGGNGEAEETEVEDVEEETSLPASLKELTIDRGDPPNYLLFASGFCVIVLMREAILIELARWGIWFGHLALYVMEAITIGLAAFTNVAAEPIAFVLTVVGWAVMAVQDLYQIIVETTPVLALTKSLLLSLAVLTIGDVTAPDVKGSRSRLLGIATAVGLAAVLEFVNPGVMILALAALTAYASFVRKADRVSVFMPATVTLVAVSEPIIQAVVFASFLILSIHAHWKAAPEASLEQQETEPSVKRPSPVFVAITSAICISLAARLLYARSLLWLALR